MRTQLQKILNSISSAMKFLILLFISVIAVESFDVLNVEHNDLLNYPYPEEKSIPEDAKLTVVRFS